MSTESNESREDARTSEPKRKSKKDWESIFRTLSIVAIPIVLAIIGWVIQERLQRQTIGRDYVQLAASILREPDTAKTNSHIRVWAVDLLNDNSPTKFSDEAASQLKSGKTIFPASIGAFQPNDVDPLRIAGTWTYTTTFQSEQHPNGIDGFLAFQGYNTITPLDGRGYRMEGERTHFKKEGSNNFQKYDHAKRIELSRIGFSPLGDRFYFYFEIKDENRRGFVDMTISPPGSSKMNGNIYYLHSNGQWAIARIVFEKSQ